MPAMGTMGPDRDPYLLRFPDCPAPGLGPWENDNLAALPGPEKFPRASGPPAPNPERHQPCRILTMSILQRLAEKPIQKTPGI